MWDLTPEERHQLAKGGENLDRSLQTKKQLFSIYKEELVLRKKFEEVLSCYDEDDSHRNASGVTQRMDQALAERRRYFSVNTIKSPPGKSLCLPHVLTSSRSFQKPVLKPIERTLPDGVKFGNFPALSRQHNDKNKNSSFEVKANVEALVKQEKPGSNNTLILMESSRSSVNQKRGPLQQKDSIFPVESPRMAIQPIRKMRSLSFPSSSALHRGSYSRSKRPRENRLSF